jgi:hypothetical protein
MRAAVSCGVLAGAGFGASVAAHSEQLPAPLGASRINLHAMRCKFPGLWAAFVRAHFRDVTHAAYALGVTERTARGWWEGAGSPSAPVLAAIEDRHPGAILALLRAAA